jgi:hypothetical protein
MRGSQVAVVEVGRAQQLLFRETEEKLPPYDGLIYALLGRFHTVPLSS